MCACLSKEEEFSIFLTFGKILTDRLIDWHIEIAIDLEGLCYRLSTCSNYLALSIKNSLGDTISTPTPPLLVLDIDWLATQPEWIVNKVKAHFDFLPKIPASKCEVALMDKKTTQEFLHEHHPLGPTTFHKSVGLIYKHQLVSLSTFGKPRKWVKGHQPYVSGEWIRMCTKRGVSVVGSAGKMLDLYLKLVQLDDMITYQDPDWGDAQVLEKLGFVKETEKKIINLWVSKIDLSRHWRLNKTDSDLELFYPIANKKSEKWRLLLSDRNQ